MSETKSVSITLHDNYALVLLNDQATRNALSETAAVAMRQMLESVSKPIRAIIVSGAGKGFCSGAKLGSGSETQNAEAEKNLSDRLKTYYNPLFITIKNLNIPIISAVNGPAAGIGFALAMSADFILASDNAFFLPAFSRVGLIPDGGACYLLCKALGRVRAMEIALLDEKISANQALEWGLINRVVGQEQLMPRAVALAQRLADGPTLAYAELRKLMWGACERTFEEQLTAEADSQRKLGQSKDHAEGVRAFLNREAPRFYGE